MTGRRNAACRASQTAHGENFPLHVVVPSDSHFP
jgi:hypothetical protein